MSPQMPTELHKRPKIALLLQGGGALGAYHIGAYQALAEAALHPSWVAGISIGAINAAVIAGNPPDARVDRLTDLWNAISWPELHLTLTDTMLQTMHNWASNATALVFGQPNFFAPRLINPLLLQDMSPQSVSFYDTSPMLATLARFADFALINQKTTRLSLGATNVETAELVFFDNHHQAIRPEHVLASGSLPPGFPATSVDGALYWDGGCVSNTPLDIIVDEPDIPHLVVFMVDLWSPRGRPPTNMNEAAWRAKQIQYASRSPHQIEAVAAKVNLRHAMRLARQAGVKDVEAVPDSAYLGCGRLDIVHIIYQPEKDQIPNSDAEFSRASIQERRAAGYRDMQLAIGAEPWKRVEKPAHLGALIHRVYAHQLKTLPEPDLRNPQVTIHEPPVRKAS
jgi:NTE family protein